jgi:hypothetical protein
MECLEKYGSGLPVDETFRVKWFSDRIYALIQKIRASDDFLQGNSSDKDFTEPAAEILYISFLPAVTKLVLYDVGTRHTRSNLEGRDSAESR